MLIRFAAAEDSAELLKIYAQYINTPITFEYSLPTEQEFAQRITEISKSYPYLVCEEDGQIVGYAYAHMYGEREAYKWNAELSVYIDETCTSKGLGKRFYHILIEILKLQGMKTVYGIVTVPNGKSEKLHHSMGFHHLGTYHSGGYKNGKWHDVALFEKSISPYDLEPVSPVSITHIPADKLHEILNEIK
ncbi:MAG: GNAT family N-acetyltransferase [Muricomes sp.]